LGISLEKAETETRIRIQYLRALEADDFSALPNSVVASGFTRNYAAYLGLDGREAASRYTALATPVETAPAPVKPVPIAAEMFHPVPLHDVPGPRRRWRLAFGLFLVPLVVLAAWAWWNYPWVSGFFQPRPKPTPTEFQGATGVATATLTPTNGAALAPTAPPDRTATATDEATTRPSITPSSVRSPTPSRTPTRPIYTGVFVELNFLGTSWVQVSVDGVRQVQGEVQAGTRQSWYGDTRVELRIGNAGVVEVTVNGEKLGTLGAVGEVVDQVFEKAGAELSTTPELSVTLTITPTATLIPTPPATEVPPPTAPLPSPTATVPVTTPSGF